MRSSSTIKNKQQEEKENIKILREFFEKSSAVLENARKEVRTKYPELFKTS